MAVSGTSFQTNHLSCALSDLFHGCSHTPPHLHLCHGRLRYIFSNQSFIMCPFSFISWLQSHSTSLAHVSWPSQVHLFKPIIYHVPFLIYFMAAVTLHLTCTCVMAVSGTSFQTNHLSCALSHLFHGCSHTPPHLHMCHGRLRYIFSNQSFIMCPFSFISWLQSHSTSLAHVSWPSQVHLFKPIIYHVPFLIYFMAAVTLHLTCTCVMAVSGTSFQTNHLSCALSDLFHGCSHTPPHLHMCHGRLRYIFSNQSFIMCPFSFISWLQSHSTSLALVSWPSQVHLFKPIIYHVPFLIYFMAAVTLHLTCTCVMAVSGTSFQTNHLSCALSDLFHGCSHTPPHLHLCHGRLRYIFSNQSFIMCPFSFISWLQSHSTSLALVSWPSQVHLFKPIIYHVPFLIYFMAAVTLHLTCTCVMAVSGTSFQTNHLSCALSHLFHGCSHTPPHLHMCHGRLRYIFSNQSFIMCPFSFISWLQSHSTSLAHVSWPSQVHLFKPIIYHVPFLIYFMAAVTLHLTCTCVMAVSGTSFQTNHLSCALSDLFHGCSHTPPHLHMCHGRLRYIFSNQSFIMCPF